MRDALSYRAADNRYALADQLYQRCGNSGILLPRISLGLWKGFGANRPLSESRAILHYAFDQGITHFDLANNYGPPYGSAEETFGTVYDQSFRPYRDELFIATKAGYDMWPGPYGNWGSRKYLMASLDQSLKRMNLDYVDLFYSHRYDPHTPLNETLQALADIVHQGKALYVGLSRWPAEAARYAENYLQQQRVRLLTYQGRLNLLDRAVESDGTLDFVEEARCGFVAFSPLAQGTTDQSLLTRHPCRFPHAYRRDAQGGSTNARAYGKPSALATRSGIRRTDTLTVCTSLGTPPSCRNQCYCRCQPLGTTPGKLVID